MGLTLRVDLGHNGRKYQVIWHKDIIDFPKLLTHEGKTWGWVFYDKDINKSFDYILIYGELTDPNILDTTKSQWP